MTAIDGRILFKDRARILELAANAGQLLSERNPQEKRRLLDLLLSNSTWKDGQLDASFREPFDILADTATRHRKQKAAGTLPDDLSKIWLPGLVSQSVVFWDTVGLEMARGSKGHVRITLSSEPLF